MGPSWTLKKQLDAGSDTPDPPAHWVCREYDRLVFLATHQDIFADDTDVVH
jgi:hypothetical protein